MEKVSVFIITLNEERNIKRCLESVKWADEVVVVDSFSKDKTVKIAKDFGCKVYQMEFTGFGPVKNFALSKTKNLWVLNIDADEFLSNGLIEEIKETMRSPQFSGYYFPRKSYVGKRWLKYSGQYPSYQLRLFRKDIGKFENVDLHERVKTDGKVGHMKNDMMHYNYESWSVFIQRMDRRTAMEAQELLRKKHVWFYSRREIKSFFSEFLKMRKNGNTILNSVRLAKNVMRGYELIPAIPFRPFCTFFRRYLLQQGFRDGMYGFIWCMFSSIHTFIAYAKYYELKHKLAGFEWEPF
jgi:glycosyltransferase involved in cell wall biosynthesis